MRLDSRVESVTMNDAAGEASVVVPQSGERISAATVVDATGDAVVARAVGVPARKGREKDGAVMPVNYCYRFGPIDVDEVARQLPESLLEDPASGDRFLLLSGPHERIDAAIARERAAGRLSIPRDHISAAISVPGQPTSTSRGAILS